MLPDAEYRAIARAARQRRKPVAQIVRESLRRTLAEPDDVDPEKRIAAILRFARFEGPTGDIEQVLADIERGRGLT